MDIRFSILMAHLANLQRDPKKRPQPYEWKDFKMSFGLAGAEGPPDEPRPVEDLLKIARMWTKATGGVVSQRKESKPN